LKEMLLFLIFIIMKFNKGQLVWVAPIFEGEKCGGYPALILKAYISQPRIFLSNKKLNKLWLEDEDDESGWVYDILIDGVVDEAVMAEWLLPFKIKYLK
jgi:hypothetical protein